MSHTSLPYRFKDVSFSGVKPDIDPVPLSPNMDQGSAESEQLELMAPKSLFGPFEQTGQKVMQAHGFVEVASASKVGNHKGWPTLL